jgi:hypothetical protein
MPPSDTNDYYEISGMRNILLMYLIVLLRSLWMSRVRLNADLVFCFELTSLFLLVFSFPTDHNTYVILVPSVLIFIDL